MIRIFVDADACPVKKEIERISTRHNIKTFLVCNGGIRPPLNPNIQLVVVNQKLDAADDWIIHNVRCRDICVTNDILLAERCIKKGAFVIKPNGSFYTEDNIGVAIAATATDSKLDSVECLHVLACDQVLNAICCCICYG